MQCIFCGCTEQDACIDPNNQPCKWTLVDPSVCSICFEEHVAEAMVLYARVIRFAAAMVMESAGAGVAVELVSEGQASELLRSRGGR